MASKPASCSFSVCIVLLTCLRIENLGAFPIADNSSYVSPVEEIVIVTDTICESLGTSLPAYLSEASSYAATTTVVASKSSSTFQAITSTNSRSDESKTAIPSPATSILYTPQTVTASDLPEPYDVRLKVSLSIVESIFN